MDLKLILVLGAIVVLILVFTAMMNNQFSKKMKRLAESRPPLAKDQYVTHFVSKGYDQDLVVKLYDKVNDFLGYDWFSPYPEDDLIQDYQIDPEEIEDWTTSLLSEEGKELPHKALRDELNDRYEKIPFTIEYILEFHRLEGNVK